VRQAVTTESARCWEEGGDHGADAELSEGKGDDPLIKHLPALNRDRTRDVRVPIAGARHFQQAWGGLTASAGRRCREALFAIRGNDVNTTV
jgi:hypothetical protein